jgi:Ca2+/H+ antiporter, TMEM165/GDT1 family
MNLSEPSYRWHMVLATATLSTHASSTTALVLAVFGASLVEMVEALTLVVAAGTRSWRSALEGTAAALVLLTVLTAVIGIPLSRYLPIDTLRVVVGALLLLLGLQWLRKAILRSGGRLAKHDEDAIYAKTVSALADEGTTRDRDGAAFLVAFKGVMLEGFEVVLIVISLGASAHHLGAPAATAAAAARVVGGVGLNVSRQLSNVPENALKTVVGVMLTTFGVFWVGEGAGVKWPGGDLAIPVLIGVFAATTAAMVTILRHPRRPGGARDWSDPPVPDEVAS